MISVIVAANVHPLFIYNQKGVVTVRSHIRAPRSISGRVKGSHLLNDESRRELTFRNRHNLYLYAAAVHS